ncbi:hypothetical protein VTN96DRAFT_9370 [Rasamsonia emersonii]
MTVSDNKSVTKRFWQIDSVLGERSSCLLTGREISSRVGLKVQFRIVISDKLRMQQEAANGEALPEEFDSGIGLHKYVGSGENA